MKIGSCRRGSPNTISGFKTKSINWDFPLFGLAFCVFGKTDYIKRVTPALRGLKFATFGHDMVVRHEHDIRKKQHAFPGKNERPPGSPSSPSPNG